MAVMLKVVDRYLDGTPFTTAAVYPDVYRSQVSGGCCGGGPLANERGREQGGDWSSNLHYVNLPRGATHYLPAYCGNPPVCVVSAISNYTGMAGIQSIGDRDQDQPALVQPHTLPQQVLRSRKA